MGFHSNTNAGSKSYYKNVVDSLHSQCIIKWAWDSGTTGEGFNKDTLYDKLIDGTHINIIDGKINLPMCSVEIRSDVAELIDIKFGIVGSIKVKYELKYEPITGKSNKLTSVLESLKGFPTRVIGGCSIKNLYRLKSLEGSPEYVGGSFDMSNCCMVTSLVGGPKEVIGSYNARKSGIYNLIGLPEVLHKSIHLQSCQSLHSLEGISKYIGGSIHLELTPQLSDVTLLNSVVRGAEVLFDGVQYSPLEDIHIKSL